MMFRKVVWLGFFMASICLISGVNIMGGQVDRMRWAQCYSKCCMLSPNKTDNCPNFCLKDIINLKNGFCPKVDVTINFINFVRDCSDTCGGDDYKCPGAQKCCKFSSCGWKCYEPIIPTEGLPPAPLNFKLKEKNEMVSVQWHEIVGQHLNFTVYLLESRNHIGVTYNESMMSEFRHHKTLSHSWEPLGQLTKISQLVHIKAGRFYQFRLATVNYLGSLGFQYSNVLKLQRDPRPPKPLSNVTASHWSTYDRKTLNRQIKWQVTKSELPVEKVKISWYPKHSNSSTSALRAVVNASKGFYEIRDLQPNVVYILKVTAISFYGDKRLRSLPVEGQFKTPAISKKILLKKFIKNQALHKPPKQPTIPRANKSLIWKQQRNHQRRKFDLKIRFENP